jgi:DnaJ-class molecular chaperone
MQKNELKDNIEIDAKISAINHSIKRVSAMLAQIELLRIMNEEEAIDLDTRMKYVERISKQGKALDETEKKCKTCEGEGEIPSNNFSPNNPNLIDTPYTRCPDCHGSGIEN